MFLFRRWRDRYIDPVESGSGWAPHRDRHRCEAVFFPRRRFRLVLWKAIVCQDRLGTLFRNTQQNGVSHTNRTLCTAPSSQQAAERNTPQSGSHSRQRRLATAACTPSPPASIRTTTPRRPMLRLPAAVGLQSLATTATPQRQRQRRQRRRLRCKCSTAWSESGRKMYALNFCPFSADGQNVYRANTPPAGRCRNNVAENLTVSRQTTQKEPGSLSVSQCLGRIVVRRCARCRSMQGMR